MNSFIKRIKKSMQSDWDHKIIMNNEKTSKKRRSEE